ncbi:hypothetical protein DIPPA_08188 [Diplonema papillatum]|nr:hypothetical protein DIPPA_08188 [Diplonema papillatum]
MMRLSRVLLSEASRSVAKSHGTGIASAATRERLEKEGWTTKYDSKDTVDEKSGGKVHEETLDATRVAGEGKAKETLEAKSKKVTGDNYRSEVVTQSYHYTSNPKN